MVNATSSRILLIDDTLATRYIAAKALRSAGFEVQEAKTGTEGLKFVLEKPDIVILDIQLPDINGLEVCERIKNDPLTSSIPILHVSATFTSNEDLVHGLEGGADGYLASPFDPAVLVATVRALIRIKQAEQKYKETLDKLEIERDMREQFVFTLSHDLRTPLTAVKLIAEGLQKGISKIEDPSSPIEKILTSINRADEMISNLLDSSRIKAGEKLPLQIEELDLPLLVSGTLKNLATIHGDRFILQSPAILKGYWSPHELQRMIENLASNAIKYGHPSTPIRITIKATAMSVQIDVHNKGNPLSTTEQTRLFEPFHRSLSAQRSGKKGWGIGLTLVRGIVQSHEGNIEIESEETKGTTFRIFLPRDCRVKSEQAS
jgi:signal transduction histidine kinase